LLSVCLGADSTAVAWSKHPEEFSEIQAMVMLQPVSGRYIVEEFVKGIGLDDGYEKFDKAVHERTGFHLSEQSPLDHVKAVTVPTLVAQVHDDTMTRPEDVQEIYDAIPVAEKACIGSKALTAASTGTTSSASTPNFRSSGSTNTSTDRTRDRREPVAV
jgi:hypothetical protein